MLLVLIKWNRIGDFNRHMPDLYLKAERAQRAHELLVKIGDRTRIQSNPLEFSLIRLDREMVIKKIKLDLEDAVTVRNRRRI